jgi:hypothetical protein
MIRAYHLYTGSDGNSQWYVAAWVEVNWWKRNLSFSRGRTGFTKG